MALTKITTSLVAVNTLTAANIADNTIDATKIAQNQILARHIAAGALSDQLTGITNSSGDFTIDIVGDIILDADGADILFKDGGTQFGSIRKNGNNIQLMAAIEDGDITFHGDDSGTAITALKLDMSAGGKATFRGGAVFNEDSLNSDFRIESDGNANMFVVDASANKIGIGTASPAHELDVAGSVGLSGTLELASAAMIDWANGDARIKEGVTNNYDLQFQTYDGSNCTTKLTIQGGGNIGIGTTSPSGKLDIHTVDTSAYSATGEPVETAVIHNESGSDGTGATYYSSLGMTVGAGATSQGFINYVRTADNQGSFTFSQRTGSSSYAESMRIDNSGNLAIGRTDPSRLLDVKLTATNGSLHNNSTAAVHFGSQGNADGYIQGISLGYKTDGANTYAKTAIVARGLNDGAARQSLAFLVDTAADGGSAEIGDAKLIIDGTTGAVTKPAQPAFRAYLGSSFSVSAGTHTFAGSNKLTQEFDRGGNYDPSNAKFTAPHAGIYHFSATITMGADTAAVEYLSAEIVATPSGGSATRYVCGGWNSKPTGDNAYSSSAGSVTIELAANAEVTLGYETSDGITLQGGIGHCSFSGFLVA